jgi:hypothetical protein
VIFKATPSANPSRWVKWSPADSLHLDQSIRPEIVNGKTHVGYKFRTCTSFYSEGNSKGRVNTCLEMKVDCHLPASEPVPPEHCLFARNFSDQYIVSREDVSDRQAMDECKKSLAAAKVPASLMRPELTSENVELTAPSHPEMLTGPKSIFYDVAPGEAPNR